MSNIEETTAPANDASGAEASPETAPAAATEGNAVEGPEKGAEQTGAAPTASAAGTGTVPAAPATEGNAVEGPEKGAEQTGAAPTASAAPTEAGTVPAAPATEGNAVEGPEKGAEQTGSAPTASAAPTGTEAGTETGTGTGTGTGTEAAEAGSGAETPAEPGKKKRRRRRRKKKSAAGDVASPEGDGAPGSASAAPAAEKKSHAPFLRYFKGDSTKRQAFSAGDLVAGLVTRELEGAFVVDLFSRGEAYVDAWEPREIERLPEPAPEAVPQTAAPVPPATEGDAAGGAEAAAQDTGPAPSAPAEKTVSAAPLAEGDAVEGDAVEGAEKDAQEEGPAPTASAPEAETEAAAVEADPGADTSVGDTPAPEPAPAPSAPAAEPPPQREGPPPAVPSVGSVYRGRIGSVAESGHIAIVNRALDKRRVRASIAAARDAKQRVEGVVFGFNRGGFDVLVEGVRVFCPASGMALGAVPDPHVFLGQRLDFTVPPRKGSGAKSLVVSRKTILEREQRKARKSRLKTLKAGEDLDGVITQIRDYGVFVDIGDGLEGMVHQSELSWTRGVKPSEVATQGQKVRVRVVKVSTEKQGRVDLSIRVHLPDPWDEHAETIAAGTVLKGKIVRTADFGAFVELVSGIDGLLHISELGKNLKHADEAVKVGDEVDIVVERVDKGQRRISLSRLSPAEVKAIAEGTLDPKERPKSLKPGSHITVVIDKVEHHGIQVRVKGVLGRRGRGYLSNRDLGTKGEGAQRKKVVQGAELTVKVVGTDRDGGLKVSIKGLEFDEERKAVKAYRKEAAKQGFGTFGDLLRAKLNPGDEEGS